MRRTLAIIAIALMMVSAIGVAAMAYEKTGPRVDEIIMPIIKEQQARLIAFERGDTVVIPGLTAAADIAKVKGLPNAAVNMNYGYHMFYMCFNMRKDPFNAQVVRQAIAHIVDRDNIIRTLFAGNMLPLSSFVPQASPFYKSDVPVYPYNPTKAKQLLDAAGYVVGKDGKRIDPTTGKTMREVKFFTPTYEVAATSAEIGKIIVEAMNAIGIPAKHEPMDFNVMLGKLDVADFDMFALAWSLSRNPDFLYDFFHSSQDIEAGYNRPGIRDAQLDKALEKLYAPVDLKTAKAAADASQLILARLMPYVPLYSRPYIDGFRKDIVKGWVPMNGFGAANYNNLWTTLNIERVAGPGGTIRWALSEEPKNLNPTTASSAYEWEVLGRVAPMGGLRQIDPVTGADIPWMAKSWEIGQWQVAPGQFGTVITWNLRDDIKWSDGVPFTSADVKFTIEFLRDNKAPRYLSAVQEVARVETPDKYTAKVYFNNLSYWNIDNADLCGLPQHIWKDVKDYKAFEPWKEAHPTVAGMTKLVGLGPFTLKEYRVGEYVRLVKNANYFALPTK